MRPIHLAADLPANDRQERDRLGRRGGGEWQVVCVLDDAGPKPARMQRPSVGHGLLDDLVEGLAHVVGRARQRRQVDHANQRSGAASNQASCQKILRARTHTPLSRRD